MGLPGILYKTYRTKWAAKWAMGLNGLLIAKTWPFGKKALDLITRG